MKSEGLITKQYESANCKFKLPLVDQNITDDPPQRPKQEIINWLNEVPAGRFMYIFELGDLWGISFEREDDAVQFKLTWL